MNKETQGKLNQEVSQANKAKQLFENPLLKDSFDKLKKLYSESLFNKILSLYKPNYFCIIQNLIVRYLFRRDRYHGPWRETIS